MNHELNELNNEQLLHLLQSSNEIKIKHTIAHELHERGCNCAVEPLITEIKNKANEGYIGAFVYACERFDCSEHLELFLELLVYGEYEVSMTTVMVIENMTSLTVQQKDKASLFLNTALRDNSTNADNIEDALATLE